MIRRVVPPEDPHSPKTLSIGAATARHLRDLLSGGGLRLDLGAMTALVRTRLPDLVDPLHRVYGAFPLHAGPGFADVTVDLVKSSGLRGRLRPALHFLADGIDPFGPQDRALTLPQLEWGLNWCFAMMSNRHLLLHAGVVDVDGKGVILAGMPGAGKSTLTAALAMSGHRALSDEFGVLRPHDGLLLPLPKPVALKNRSIDLIRERWPAAVLGPTYRKTRKGDIAHLAMPEVSIAQRHLSVRPAVIILPRWREGASLTISRVLLAETFAQLARNSFNAEVLGVTAFDAIHALLSRCACWSMTFGTLDDALRGVAEICHDA